MLSLNFLEEGCTAWEVESEKSTVFLKENAASENDGEGEESGGVFQEVDS